jgi:8-oxo-dGTP pyrophosphatase MutT (NUDIX family)
MTEPTRGNREQDGRDARGFRVDAGPRGCAVRADVIDVYVLRRASRVDVPGALAGAELLQLRRAKDPLRATWQPVMGHIEAGERATQAAARELREEVGLDVVSGLASGAVAGFWALEQVWPFYIAAIDCVVLSPRFVVEVAPSWEPTLNPEHDAHRWVRLDDAERHFMWPGQLHAIREIEGLLAPSSLRREALRVDVSLLA